MTNKKDRPALFELVTKGPLKPDLKGALDTPSWFYSKKAAKANDRPAAATGAGPEASVRPIAPPTDSQSTTSFEATLPAETAASVESAVDSAAKQRPSEPTSPLPTAESTIARPSDAPQPVLPLDQSEAEHADESTDGYTDESTIEHKATSVLPLEHDATEKPYPARSVTITVPYWLIAVTALALIFVLLVAYRAGQQADSGQATSPTTPANTADAPPSDALLDITNALARGNALAPRGPGTNRVGTPPVQPRAADPTSTEASPDRQPAAGPPRKQLPALPQKGQTLIICSSAKSSILLPVQNHFADNGLRTAIGKQGGMYVLYSGLTVENSKSSQADAFKTRVVRIGANYNKARPDGAMTFNPSTFETAYWINLNRIDKTPN